MSDVIERSSTDKVEENRDCTDTPLTEPGRRLRAARTAQGITQRDVASELRLDIRIIEALENGDTTELSQQVFTAGYLRSYARYIGLSPDEIVALYIGTETTEAPSTTGGGQPGLQERLRNLTSGVLLRGISVPAIRFGQDTGYRVQIGLLAGIVLVILISWQSARWAGGDKESQSITDTAEPLAMVDESLTEAPLQGGSTQASAAPAQKAQKKDPVKSETATGTHSDKSAVKDNMPATASKPAPEPAVGNQDTQIATAPAVLNRVDTSASEEAGPSTGLAPDVPVIKRSLALPGSEDDSDDPEIGDIESSETAVAALDSATVSELVLRFSESSWVDIRDATGKKLIRELGSNGATRRISGIAPFRVVLGYGPGVEIEYNGTPYDFSSHQGKKIARFTMDVPEEEADLDDDEENASNVLPADPDSELDEFDEI